jgi:hypothetical protein
MIGVYQIIGGVGEEGMAFVSAGPLRGRIRRGDELWCHWRRSTESGIREPVHYGAADATDNLDL